MFPYTWKGRRTPPDMFTYEKDGGKQRPPYYMTYRCNMKTKTKCPVRFKIQFTHHDSGAYSVAIFQSGAHRHDMCCYTGAGMHPTAREMVRRLIRYQITGPSTMQWHLLEDGLPQSLLPTLNQLRNFPTKATLQLEGLQSTVAGLVHSLHRYQYYARRAVAGPMGWTLDTPYIIPGPDPTVMSPTNVLLVVTTDRLCSLFIRCVRSCHGGWLGADGKHRTNYCNFPVIPLVGKDCDDRYFIACLALVSDERGPTCGRLIRLFLCWLVRRFPSAVTGLPLIETPDQDGAMPDPDGYDPAIQEETTEAFGPPEASPEAEEGRSQLRCKWEEDINKGVLWQAMLHGYQTETLPEGDPPSHFANRIRATMSESTRSPPALRVAYGGADNSDNYAAALAFGAHAVVANCAMHMIVSNATKRNTNLWTALGGAQNYNNDAVAALKLLRDMPSVSATGPLNCSSPQPCLSMFEQGMELLLQELRDANMDRAARLLLSGYVQSLRKRRWTGACFPPLIPNHNSGTESMNKIIARDLGRYTISEVVEFSHNMLGFMKHRSQAATTSHAQPEKMKRVETMYPMWRRVHWTRGEEPRFTNSAERSRFLAHVQIGRHRRRFFRATSERYLIPSQQLLTQLYDECEGQRDSDAHSYVDSKLTALRVWYTELIRNPQRVGTANGVTLDTYLRLSVRSFYVLERLEPGEVRYKHSAFRCTCPFHRVRSACKHTVACTLIESRQSIPSHLQLDVIGRRPQRGRKAIVKTTRCLNRLADTIDLSASREAGTGPYESSINDSDYTDDDEDEDDAA